MIKMFYSLKAKINPPIVEKGIKGLVESAKSELTFIELNTIA